MQMMAGVYVGYRMAFAGSSSLSTGTIRFVELKNKARLLHLGRYTNWKNTITSQQIKEHRGFTPSGCAAPTLQG